ncbi:MAG TPA: hypothetical protein VGI05_18155 [Streptosporangiaceae bacterium]
MNRTRGGGHGAAEAGSEPVDRRRVRGGWLRRPERAAPGGDVAEPGTAERELLLGKIIGKAGRLAGGPGQIPAMHQQLGDAQVQRGNARDSAERHGDHPLQRTGLAERREQPAGGVAIRGQQILPCLAGIRRRTARGGRGRAAAQNAREHPVTSHDVADQVADGPVRARGGVTPLVIAHCGNQPPGGLDGLSELACWFSGHQVAPSFRWLPRN